MSPKTKDVLEFIEKRVDDMTLFDDELMGRVFDENIIATEQVLRIIMGRNIKVIRVKGQTEFRNPKVGGRSITLDVHAIDTNGSHINIEVQCKSEGAHVRRARFHSSMTDSRMLDEGQNFKELNDSYVIFIYKHDKFRKGLPIYHLERYVQETGELVGDGSHIIYVNGNYKGDDPLGHLIHDFHQLKSEDIENEALAYGVNFFKETEEGREIMSKSVDDKIKEFAMLFAEDMAQDMAQNMAKQHENNMLYSLVQKGKLELDVAAEEAGVDVEEFEKEMIKAGYKVPELV